MACNEVTCRPASATSTWINLIGMAALLGTLYGLHGSSLSVVDQTFLAIYALAMPILLLELYFLRVHRRDSTGLAWDRPWQPAPGRVLTKLAGLLLTLGAVAFLYWLFPEYHGNFYARFWDFLKRYGGWMLALAPLYFLFVDGWMRDPHDGYWHVGRLLFAPREVDRKIVGDHARGWLIKGFFLPLMFIYLSGNLENISRWQPLSLESKFMAWFALFHILAFTVDLAFTCAGYILSFRLFDTHIRSAEPTLLGWVVAIACYQPFYSALGPNYFNYDDNMGWEQWTAGIPLLQVAWGSAILLLLWVYALATISFGCRFSNLTHRGILTNGPYRFTKHPAYLTKNLSWWLISIPFIASQGGLDAFRNCLILLALNLLYYLRARTEERHLSADPAYVAYALWMEEHGWMRWVGRLIPVFRYRQPGSGELPPMRAQPLP